MEENFLTADEIRSFSEGRNFHIYKTLGAQKRHGKAGVHFAVWAPNAKTVSVMGDFNNWNKNADFLSCNGDSGLWSGIIEEADTGQHYKYHIVPYVEYETEKSDPMAFCAEIMPGTASVICDLDYEWSDCDWMKKRRELQSLESPISIYEVHIGSWRRKMEEHNRPLNYDELGDALIPYVKEMGFTHVEFMPVMEHPFGGSWGYQITGYFAPSRNYGDPESFMRLIDRMHQADIGVILDWVPSHFPADAHGLVFFDGTHLYEHADPRQGFHPEWNSCIFNFGRNEVRSFLISNALFWLDRYHIDGLRVDAVASMLYLDYSRSPGEWIPNQYGGRENLEAVEFIKALNEAVYSEFPDVQMIAEESTAWPGVSRPTYNQGLGFGYKWDMGWMNDTLRYFQRDSAHRKYHHDDITFRSVYAFHENFLLALSHDEVVHGKGSLLNKMNGDEGQKFSSLRCLYTYMMAQPGKKLLFMGQEFGQVNEWNHNCGLDWHLLQDPCHQKIQKLVQDLNMVYRRETALHIDCGPSGYQLVDGADTENSVLSFLRKNDDTGERILCIFNFSPSPHEIYKVGVPFMGHWEVFLDSDSFLYGGSGFAATSDPYETVDEFWHGQLFHIALKLPPLGGLLLKWAN